MYENPRNINRNCLHEHVALRYNGHGQKAYIKNKEHEMKKLIRTGVTVLLVCGVLFTNIFQSTTVFAEDFEGGTPADATATNEMHDTENEMADAFEKLNYLYINKPYMETPEAQEIVVSFGDGTEQISHMTALMQRDDGVTFDAVLDRKEAETYLLKYTFVPGDEGIYQVMQLTYTMAEQQYTLDLPSIGVDAKFGICQEYSGYSEDGTVVTRDGIIDEGVSMSIIQPEDGQEVSSEEIEAAILASEAEMPIESYSSQGRAATRDDKLVVVIDPGHGGSDPGAVSNGIREKNTNLKIAEYCRDELQQYSGVSVYMTREDDRYLGLKERVDIAASHGADLFLSVHLNSSVYSSANGAEVYYPNANYNSEIHNNGKDAAQNILNQLVALGLNNRGIIVKDATDNDKYPDGSKGDYYTVINESKRAGFPGLIVEHAFLSNLAEAERLQDENFLAQLGAADATGVAQAYGLTKGTTAPSLPYTDVTSDSWFYDAAKEAYERGLMSGLNTTTFGPSDLLTRGMVATILWRNAGEPSMSYSQVFPDLQDGQYYTTAVLWAHANGVMSGYENGYCGANDHITREQFATLMYRYANQLALDTNQSTGLDIFPDGMNTSTFAKTAVEWCAANKIITGMGDGVLAPQGLTNRAEAATIIVRFMRQYGL